MASGDTLIWTSNGNNGGNGPLSVTFGRGQAGVGAFIQADGPSTFTAQIQAFNSAGASLASFTETSDSSGHAIYIGVSDSTGPNIAAVVFSLVSAQGAASDFAIDSLALGSSAVGAPPTPAPTIAPTAAPTRTPTATATATARPNPTATPITSGIIFVGAGPLADYSTAVTTVSVGLPPGVQSGDTLLAQIIVYDGGATVVPTPPSGWTGIRRDAVSNGNKATSWLYYKVAAANEPASYGWNISPNWAAGVMGAWRGASVSPIDNASGAGAAGASPVSLAAPSLTPSNSNELQIYFYGSQSSGAPTIALSNALTRRFDVSSSKEGFTLAFADLAAPSANIPSPTYPATATVFGGAALTAQAILLIPASQGSAPIPTRTAVATPTAPINPMPTATPTTSGITFVGAGPLADYSTAVTAVTVGLPPGVRSGDTLLAQIVVYDGSASVMPTPPSGWTSIRRDAVSNGNKITSWLYYKVAGASEPVSYSWNISSQYAAGVMGAWRGASSSPIDQHSGATAAGVSPISAAAPSLTPSRNNELQIYFYGSQSASAPTISEPALISQRFDTRSAKEGFALAFGDAPAPSVGTALPTYTATATTNSNGFSVMTAQGILLKPGP